MSNAAVLQRQLNAPALELPSFLATPGRSVRVCLVRTPTVTTVGAVGQDAVPALGLAYLAGSLKSAGHVVTGVDAVGEAVHQYTKVKDMPNTLMHGLTVPQIVARVDPEAEVIGVSCMFSVDWLISRDVVNAIRARFPKALIVVGGEHVTAVPEYVAKDCPAADLLVLGEGEETLLDLLDAHVKGRDLATVPGLGFRRNGELVLTGRRGRLRDVDDIPVPDWTIFPVTEYIDNALTHGANLGRTMPILASRGCPYQCTFCSNPVMWGPIWKARKPEAVLAEMKQYMQTYGATNFDFYDLTAIVKREWILEFTRLLMREKMDITWQLPSGTRSEAIDTEVSEHLYKSGCRIMNYAPESGSPAELARIKKKVDPDKMIASMIGAHKVGVEIKVNFIFGLPGMQWGDVYRTFKFMARLAFIGVENIAAFPYSPYPGSELFDMLLAQGKVRLDEGYFRTLLAYTDPEHSVSYCDTIGSRMLSVLCISSMLWFFGLSVLTHPARGARLVYGLLTGDQSNKLAMAMSNRTRKKAAMNLFSSLHQDTVVIPPMFRPKRVASAA